MDDVIGISVLVIFGLCGFEAVTKPIWTRWKNRRWAQMSQAQRDELTAKEVKRAEKILRRRPNHGALHGWME